jgi:hypothetical protein
MDIPMAHLEDDIVPESIEVIPDDSFSLNTETIINPFDIISDETSIFFNQDNSRIVPTLKRENNTYVYQPDSTVEFSPDSFDVSAIIKKNLTYDSSKTYHVHLGVNNDLTWAKQLITIFGSAGTRQICPANIIINDQSNLPSSLTAKHYDQIDFTFVKTYDGNALNSAMTSYLDVATILKQRTNLWITVSHIDEAFPVNKTNTCRYTSPQIYNQSFVCSDPIASNTYEFPYYPKNLYTYHQWMINAPFYILERPNLGFLIISSEQFLNNLSKNAKLIYETLFQVYAKTYLKTVFKHSWITDSPVDYLNNPTCTLKRNHAIISLPDMITDSHFGYNFSKNEYTLQLLDLDAKSAVVYSKTDEYQNLIFSKLLKTDPIKDQNQISLYTSKGTVIYYEKTVIKQIESKIQVKTSIEEDDTCVNSYICKVTVLPIKSSAHKIYTSKEYTFTLQYPKRLYYLVATQATRDNAHESDLYLLDEYEYSPGSGMAIATIQVKYSSAPIATDVRQLGGGAPPEKRYDDYELMDIGSLKGRPYRIGTSMVIKLPKRLEKYDAYIADAISARKLAADMAIIKYM